MISRYIERVIREFSEAMGREHPAVVAARQGKISAAGVAAYLSSVHLVVSSSVPQLQRAVVEARRRGWEDLALHFEQKIAEERGHEAWAEADLGQLEAALGAVSDQAPVPAAKDLVLYLHSLIDADPRLYLVYTVISEYFTVVGGPIWMDALCSGSGIPRDALTVVSKHVAADSEHSQVGFGVVEAFASDPALRKTVEETVHRSLNQFGRVFEEVRECAA